MRARDKVTILALLALVGCAMLASSYPAPAVAQEQMKDAVETFAFDLHAGMKRGNLTDQQKQQVRNDLMQLRQAHQNHDRRSALRAMMNFHQLLDSGAFQPQDAERIKQDLKEIREAKQQSGGGMGGGMR